MTSHEMLALLLVNGWNIKDVDHIHIYLEHPNISPWAITLYVDDLPLGPGALDSIKRAGGFIPPTTP